MTSTVSLLQFFSPLRLAGPVFDKELRVASRRPRSYGLRAGYVMLLTVLIVSAWCQVLGMQNAGPAFGASRLSYMAMRITALVLWFQFVAAQLIVAAILSSSLGSEMRVGALAVLLTTPTSASHIIVGKLAGGLLQVCQFLLIGLPVLGLVRVLGGVPWEPVFACFCITMTAVVFAGAMSLLLSTYWHHPYDAVSAGAVVYLFLWVVVPAVAVALISAGQLNQTTTQAVLNLTNPFRALYVSGPWAVSGAAGRFFSWTTHCLIMMTAAALASCISTWRLHRAVSAGPLRRPRDDEFTPDREDSARWSMMGLASRRWWRRGNLAIAGMALAVCVSILTSEHAGLRNVEVYAYYFAWGLWTVALLRLTVSVAGAIAREKECGAWSVLLTTPLEDDQILRGKARAGLRGNAVLLISAQAVQVCFLLAANPHSRVLSLAQCLFSAAASTFLVVAAGLYFGVRLKNTAAAVAATLGTYLCVNYIVCGRYNPLFGWMLFSLLSASGSRTHLALLGFGMGSAAFVLDVAVGLLLVRQAVKTMRSHVF